MALFERVKRIVARELSQPESEVTKSATFGGDLKGDSLEIIELVMALEEEFGVEIPEEDAEGIRSVGDMVRYLEGKGVAV